MRISGRHSPNWRCPCTRTAGKQVCGMRSPRFHLRSAQLQSALSASNLLATWKSKVRVDMQDQFILDPVQHFDFHLNALNECARISKRVLGGEYTPSRSQKILIEKSKGLCRQLVIPHVDDALVLQCLSDGLFLAISANAPTTKSFYAPQDHPFSKNLLAAERYYGSFQAWLNFQRSIFNFSKRYRYIVVTDIGNYYDLISYSHLRNVISSVAKAPEHLMDLLLYVLAGLLWQPDYMPRVEVGLPQINLDAPRLLAHAFLYELDTFLSQTPGIDFARYMDDIDIGVDSVPAAKVVLRDVDLVLQTRQVRLNSGKTQILTSAEASRHFRIAENAQLDTLTREIERRSRAGISSRKQTASVERQLRRGLARGSFEGGNGEKILKRLLTLARRTTAPIPERDLEYVLRMWPGSRENVFEYLAARELTTSTARTLLSFLQSGIVVDDASRILMVNWLNHTRAPRRVGPERYLRRIADELSEDGFLGYTPSCGYFRSMGRRTNCLRSSAEPNPFGMEITALEGSSAAFVRYLRIRPGMRTFNG